MFSNEIYMEESCATDYLGRKLYEGSLALVIGSGASMGLGLPDWYNLVKSCLEQTHSSPDIPDSKKIDLRKSISDDLSNEDLLAIIDELEILIDDSDKYHKIVQESLYKNANIDFKAFKNELLIALGALVVGAKRGSVREILSFNFDNILEFYFHIYGLQTDVIHALPSLRRDRDVTIYHPHGYLPYNSDISNFSKFLILSEYSYDERLGTARDTWKELTRDFFLRKVCLFVGLSGDDIEIKAILTSVSKEIMKNRPTGFWLFGKPIGKMLKEKLLRRNIVPVQLDGYDKYPEFMLSICQKASLHHRS